MIPLVTYCPRFHRGGPPFRWPALRAPIDGLEPHSHFGRTRHKGPARVYGGGPTSALGSIASVSTSADDVRPTPDSREWRSRKLRARSVPPRTTSPRFRNDEAISNLPSAFQMQAKSAPILELIPLGDKLLGNLLHAGWIERRPDLNTGDLYRIIEAGRIAVRMPVPIK